MSKSNDFKVSVIDNPKVLRDYLESVAGDYMPRLSSTVNIEEYACKLCTRGIVLGLYGVDNVLAGVIAGYCNDEINKVAFVSQLHVIEKARCCGNGKLLMDEFFAHAKTCGMQKVVLMVNKNNQIAMQFYSRYGLVLAGETDTQYEMSKLI